MKARVLFFSWFRDLTGCAETEIGLREGATVADVKQIVFDRFPKLKAAEKSALVAVGVEYQSGDFILTDGDEVSFFPPVQGG